MSARLLRRLLNRFFPISEDEFLTRYAAHSKMTVAEVMHERETGRCDCGEKGCRGWKMDLKPRWWYSAHKAAGGCEICRPATRKTHG